MVRPGIWNYGYWKRSLKLHVHPHVDAACRYLEQCGYEFLVDFGTENAWDKAWVELERDVPESIQ